MTSLPPHHTHTCTHTNTHKFAHPHGNTCTLLALLRSIRGVRGLHHDVEVGVGFTRLRAEGARIALIPHGSKWCGATVLYHNSRL